MKFQTLYGKDSKGNLKIWEIETVGDVFIVTHGRKGGKLQTRTTTVKPKNVGRANETTAERQAIKEAQAKWKKQQDKGYSIDPNGISEVKNPMLAMCFTKAGHRIDWFDKHGVYFQPKLDGVRCEAYYDEQGELKLKSRGGKFYPVPPQVEQGLQGFFDALGRDTHFDGELYIHGMPLQDIVSAVKKPNDNTPKIEFHIFDIPTNREVWGQRRKVLNTLADNVKLMGRSIRIVRDVKALKEEDMWDWLEFFTDSGFEGLMIRQGRGVYKYNYRSVDLIKLKKMQDKEFMIVGHDVDKDGCVMWQIRVAQGVECLVTPQGSKDRRKELVPIAHRYYGKLLKTQFQDYTKDGNLQFPVGIIIRETNEKGEIDD